MAPWKSSSGDWKNNGPDLVWGSSQGIPEEGMFDLRSEEII